MVCFLAAIFFLLPCDEMAFGGKAHFNNFILFCPILLFKLASNSWPQELLLPQASK
jgi:hypothetical protein